MENLSVNQPTIVNTITTNVSLNNTNLDCTKRNSTKKLSDLLIYHQNVSGINNKIEEPTCIQLWNMALFSGVIHQSV
jgi:hypothetical protein